MEVPGTLGGDCGISEKIIAGWLSGIPGNFRSRGISARFLLFLGKIFDRINKDPDRSSGCAGTYRR